MLQLAAALALFSFGVGAAFFFYDTHRLMLDGDKALRDLDTALQVQALNLSADEQHLDSVLSNLDGTISQLNQAAVEQRAYWKKTSADSDKTVEAMRLTIDRFGLLVKHTDQTLNSSLLPDLDRDVTMTSQSAQLSLASFGHAGDALTLQLDDPAISDLAKNLDASAASINETSAHLEKTTADIQQAVHRITRPPSLLKQIGLGILDVGAKLGSIAAGFVR